MNVALVHDHLLHRGGSERVLISLSRAFPDAPIYTAFFDPERTYPELAHLDIRTLPIDRVALFHRNHRLAFPLLATAFSRLKLDHDAVLCSSSGWAHGVKTTGRKIVYCYSPANWLYRAEHYIRTGDVIGRLVARIFRPYLTRWDQAAARSADRYLTSSSAVAARIRDVYGFDASVVPPPHTIDAEGPQEPVPGVDDRFFLNISRLVPHKNVDALARAFSLLPRERLVVVGSGPERERLRALSPRNVTYVGTVIDDQLRWLYAHCRAVVSTSHEDFGLTPLEGNAFGRPAAVLRWGGFLDTVVEGVTGVYFDGLAPRLVADAIQKLATTRFDPEQVRHHADRFSEQTFITRIRSVVSA